MKATHTPGPWHTQGCTIYAGKNRVAQTWDTCDDLPTPTMEADADLIAAAPELLAALKSLVEDFERIIGRPIEAEHEAKAAIAKATGGAA